MHRKIALLIVFALIIGLTFNCSKQVNEIDEVDSRTKVLFIGSSYFGWHSMPTMVKYFAQFTEKEMFSYEWIEYVRFLKYFADHPQIDNTINYRNWNYIILQGVGINMGYPDTHHTFYPYGYFPVYEPVATISLKAKENYSSTKTVYCMPWAFEDGILWIENQSDDYFAMQKKIYDNTLDFPAGSNSPSHL